MSNATAMLAGVGLLSVCCISSSVAASMMGGKTEEPTEPTVSAVCLHFHLNNCFQARQHRAFLHTLSMH